VDERGKRAAIRHDDARGFELLDLEDGTTRMVLAKPDESEGVSAMAMFPAGDRVITGSMDGLIRVWDTASEKCLTTIKARVEVCALAVTADGKVLSADEKQLRLWDLGTGKASQQAKHGVGRPLGMCVDGARLAVFGEGLSLEVRSLPGLELLARWDHDSPITAAALRGEHVALGGPSGAALFRLR
jgi:WD40 repeat protein